MTCAISDRRPMLLVLVLTPTGYAARRLVSGRRAAAGLASAGPRAGRDEQRLGVEVGEPDRGQVREALDADVAAPPLREELAVEGVEALELEDVVGEQEHAADEPVDGRRHPVGSEEVGERAEVERQLPRVLFPGPGERLDDEKLREAVRRARAA